MDGFAYEWMDRHIDRLTVGWTDKPMDGRTDRQTNGWPDRQTDQWMVDRQADRSMDR